MPEPFNPEALTEEQHREEARKYAAQFCNLQKSSFYSFYAMNLFTPAFSEELYRQSRIHYSR
jgi:hypothetical protein